MIHFSVGLYMLHLCPAVNNAKRTTVWKRRGQLTNNLGGGTAILVGSTTQRRIRTNKTNLPKIFQQKGLQCVEIEGTVQEDRDGKILSVPA